MVSENSKLFSHFQNQIKLCLKHNFEVIDILFDPDASQYIFKYVFKNVENNLPVKLPSSRQQTIWSNGIKKLTGYSAHFVFQPMVDVSHVEYAITAMLRSSFNLPTLQIYAFIDGKNVNILIDGISESFDINLPQIREIVNPFLSKIKLTLGQIDSTIDSNTTPSKVELLDFVKIFAPCSKTKLVEYLNLNQYPNLPAKWISAQLDHLRKAGLILRRKDGQFLVTLAGLTLLPTSKSRNSSDVKRVLATARRGC